MIESFLEKISEFKSNTDPALKTRITPFKKSITSKAHVPFKIKAPDITPLSPGISDSGKIE
jgi:hypothetical protein